jgi:hypothetical protein
MAPFFHQQVTAADFPQYFGMGAEFHRLLRINAAGDRAFDHQTAAMKGSAQQGSFFVDGDISPRPDTLSAAHSNIHIPQINEGSAV